MPARRLHELELVNRLQTLAGRGSRPSATGTLRLRTGIGDDCSVFSASRTHDLLVTTDLFIEDVHFRRAWQSAHSVGHKVLTRGLSDIAAMGGVPRLAFLSLALPRKTSQRWIDEFLEGFLALARQHEVVLAGGDTGSSPHGFLADIIVVGETPRAVRRTLTSTRRRALRWASGCVRVVWPAP
jgi:thiamine-monophosphate kinase